MLLLKENQPTDFSQVEWIGTLETTFQQVAFSKNANEYQRKLSAFNKGFEALVKSKRIKQIKAEHGF